MAAPDAFLLTDGDDQGAVHLQRLDRCATGCRAPEQEHVLPVEVVLPQVSPRMEEGDVLATDRIKGGLPRGLAK